MSDYAGNPTWHTTITLPNDNDKPTASQFNLTNEPVIDRTQFLYERGLASVTTTTCEIGVSGIGYPKVVGSAGVWQDLFKDADLPGTNTFGLLPSATIQDCQVGDMLLVDCVGVFRTAGADDTKYGHVRLAVVQDFGGGNYGPTGITETETKTRRLDGATREHLGMTGAFQVTAAGDVKVKLQGRINGTTTAVGVWADGDRFTLRVIRVRPNSYSIS